MSWSFTHGTTKAKAAETIPPVFQEQPAYKEDTAHKIVLDKLAECAVALAEGAPSADSNINVASNGHMNANGIGAATVQVSISLPIGATVPERLPEPLSAPKHPPASKGHK